MTPVTEQFPRPLRLELVEGRTFKLTEPFCYNGNGLSICVPPGAMTDFASIPRILHWFMDPFGPYGPAAVVHDYMYRTGCRHRIVADAIFLEGMEYCGVPRWQRWLIFMSVMCLGFWSYNKSGA